MRKARVICRSVVPLALTVLLDGSLVALSFGATPVQAAPNPFAKCAICHSVKPDGRSGIGPNLSGVIGRKAAALPGYSYSPAFKKQALVWDAVTLDRFLTKPATVVPGTKMAFAGTADAAERQAIIAYLKGR